MAYVSLSTYVPVCVCMCVCMSLYVRVCVCVCVADITFNFALLQYSYKFFKSKLASSLLAFRIIALGDRLAHSAYRCAQVQLHRLRRTV